jgi:hypothetical protein
MSLTTPDKIRTLQRKLYLKAKAEPNFRLYLLYDKVYRADILRHAYDLARANKGAPGVDGVDFAAIEAAGLESWLDGIETELRTKTYQPQPVRRVRIPKPGGGERPLGIRQSGTAWYKPPRNWCWSRSSRRTSNPLPMATDRAAAVSMRSRKCTDCCVRGSPMWWTPTCRSISIRFRTMNSYVRSRRGSSTAMSCA